MKPSLRPAMLLLLLALLGLLAAWFLQRPPAPASHAATRRPQTSPAPQKPSIPQTVGMQQPSSSSLAPALTASPPRTTGGGKREMQAYRLAMRSGTLSLDAVERVVGDFRQRRGPPAWMPGMWCVRLLDADMHVLAEDTAAAPDDMCLVLDPQNQDAAGKPRATQFAGAGEEAMLQVRLPPQPGAKWLKVYRLAGMDRADWNTEPLGQVLATLPLP